MSLRQKAQAIRCRIYSLSNPYQQEYLLYEDLGAWHVFMGQFDDFCCESHVEAIDKLFEMRRECQKLKPDIRVKYEQAIQAAIDFCDKNQTRWFSVLPEGFWP